MGASPASSQRENSQSIKSKLEAEITKHHQALGTFWTGRSRSSGCWSRFVWVKIQTTSLCMSTFPSQALTASKKINALPISSRWQGRAVGFWWRLRTHGKNAAPKPVHTGEGIKGPLHPHPTRLAAHPASRPASTEELLQAAKPSGGKGCAQPWRSALICRSPGSP